MYPQIHTPKSSRDLSRAMYTWCVDRCPILKLSRDEILSRIDCAAQQRLRMSGPELLRAYKAGRLVDSGSVADVIVLANLLAEDDPVFASR